MWEGLIEGSYAVGVEIVHHEDHFGRLWIAVIEHSLDERGPIHASPSFGYPYMAAATHGLYFNKNFRDPVANIFMIPDPCATCREGNRRMNLPNELLAGLIHADKWPKWVISSIIPLPCCRLFFAS